MEVDAMEGIMDACLNLNCTWGSEIQKNTSLPLEDTESWEPSNEVVSRYGLNLDLINPIDEEVENKVHLI